MKGRFITAFLYTIKIYILLIWFNKVKNIIKIMKNNKEIIIFSQEISSNFLN